jgi:hypothetical protein
MMVVFLYRVGGIMSRQFARSVSRCANLLVAFVRNCEAEAQRMYQYVPLRQMKGVIMTVQTLANLPHNEESRSFYTIQK